MLKEITMDSVMGDEFQESKRTKLLADWRVKNVLLSIFIGSPLGGFIFGLYINYSLLNFQIAFVYPSMWLTIAGSLLLSTFCGLLFGFPPAIITSFIMNFFRAKRLSRLWRLMIAALVGALSGLLTDGLFFIPRAGPLAIEFGLVITLAGAISASICTLVMEFRGPKIPQHS